MNRGRLSPHLSFFGAVLADIGFMLNYRGAEGYVRLGDGTQGKGFSTELALDVLQIRAARLQFSCPFCYSYSVRATLA